MTKTLGIGLAAAFVLAVASTPVSAMTKDQFCSMWHGVCTSTGSAAICASRLNGCKASGCYHFNNPGPRCFSSNTDRNAPAIRRARDRR